MYLLQLFSQLKINTADHMSKTKAPILTLEDYNKILLKVGIASSSVTITEFQQNNISYEWTFSTAAVPTSGDEIVTMTTNENGIITYQLENTYGVCCTFTLKEMEAQILPKIVEKIRFENNDIIKNNNFEQNFPLSLKSQTESITFKNIKPVNVSAKLDLIEYFVKNYDDKDIENNLERIFKYDNKILSAQVRHINEQDHPGNYSWIEEKSKIFINDGLIYNFCTKELVSNGYYHFNWSKENEFYLLSSAKHIGAIHHSYFLKGSELDQYYGYGKPVQCAGNMEIVDGKINLLNNVSGHYKPNQDQTVICTQHLMKQNVLLENVQIQITSKIQSQEMVTNYNLNDTLFLSEVDSDKYSSWENFSSEDTKLVGYIEDNI